MLLFLLACAADGDTGGTVNGPQDLSGYATAADLAALQERLDAQAAELDELRAELDAVQPLEVAAFTGVCESRGDGTFGATLYLEQSIQVVGIGICTATDEDGSNACYGNFTMSGAELSGYELYIDPADQDGDGFIARLVTDCDGPGDTVVVTYLPG